MRFEEAKFIGRHLQKVNFNSCVNLGAGNLPSLRKKKPWIDEHIFLPLREKGVQITHCDFVSFPEIDLVVDLTNDSSLRQFEKMNGPKCFLLCNILEHIETKSRMEILNNIFHNMCPGDFLLISVPYRYPFHADPIDSGFRPSAAELSSIIDLRYTIAVEIECGSFWGDLQKMSVAKRVRKLLKPMWPFQRLAKYRENIERLGYLCKKYRVTVVGGYKI